MESALFFRVQSVKMIVCIIFRNFRGPLFHKPLTGQELFFAVSYSKKALEQFFLTVDQNNFGNKIPSFLETDLLFTLDCIIVKRTRKEPENSTTYVFGHVGKNESSYIF